ncbi:MAG TPA: hypothetical protein VJS37_12960, partial [Terriglobales bacterium]|nr:hypothetical protein [Terriglobales bacterium]
IFNIVLYFIFRVDWNCLHTTRTAAKAPIGLSSTVTPAVSATKIFRNANHEPAFPAIAAYSLCGITEVTFGAGYLTVFR